MSASDEAYAAARKAGDRADAFTEVPPRLIRRVTDAAVDAVWPLAIAAGRREAAEAIRAAAAEMVESQHSLTWFVHGEARMEAGSEWAARMAERYSGRLSERLTPDSGQTADTGGTT